MPEFDTPEERQEVHDFVSAIVDTEPMKVARKYIERESDSIISLERWHNTIVEMWFRRFSSGGDPALSGFEHVVVGEQEKSKVQGYHFWWKYYLDDGFAREGDDGAALGSSISDAEDRITYHGSKQDDLQLQFPESVTISYRWQAPDYDNHELRPLFKKIGGFFVGCSVEGLMALGTVRAYKGIEAPHVAIIEGARYDLKLFHSPNGQHIRTFYPVFKGSADLSEGVNRDPVINNSITADNLNSGNSFSVRIIAAVVNPAGDDRGFEKVTLVNVSPQEVSLSGWILEDKNKNILILPEKTILSGEFYTVSLEGDNVQLSNKGGKIRLSNEREKLIHQVVYSKAQARQQGAVILF